MRPLAQHLNYRLAVMAFLIILMLIICAIKSTKEVCGACFVFIGHFVDNKKSNKSLEEFADLLEENGPPYVLGHHMIMKRKQIKLKKNKML